MPQTRANKSWKNTKGAASGSFKPVCGAIIHVEGNSGGRLLPLQTKKGKKAKVKMDVRDTLIKKGIIPGSTRNICSSCMSHIDETIEKKSELDRCHQEGNNIEMTYSSEEEIEIDSSGDDFEEDLSQQAIEELANSMLPQIARDVTALYADKQRCSIDGLLRYNSLEWLKKRPIGLVRLLSRLCQISDEELLEEGKSSFMISKLIEIIYSTWNSKLQLPISFSENLLVYSQTHRKQLVHYNSCAGPAGSYSYLHKWILDQVADPIPYPTGLAKSVFDNEQVVGKTPSVKAENKVPGSVITSHAYLSIDNGNNIQSNDVRLCPCVWFFKAPTDAQIDNFINVSPEETNLFQMTRNAFISERLKIVCHEQNASESGDGYSDHVDTMVAQRKEAESEKICLTCGAANDVDYNTCRNEACKEKLVKRKIDVSYLISEKSPVKAYSHFSKLVKVKENKISVCSREPDFLNPNSFVNICQMLRNLGLRAGIKKYNSRSRHWLILEVDGTIFCIVERLIFNVLYCTNCKDSYYGEDAFKAHKCLKATNMNLIGSC